MSERELHTSSARTPVLLAAFGEWVTGLPLYASIAATIWIPYQVLQVLLALVLGVPAAADAVQAAGKAAAADQPFDESGAVAAAGRLLLFGLVTLALALVAAALSQAAIALGVTGRLPGAGAALGSVLRAVGGRRGAVSLLAGAAAAALSAVVFGPLPQVGLTLLYDRLRTREVA